MTAIEALRNAYAQGWGDDALVKDTAIQSLIIDGWTETKAKAEVDEAFVKHFQIMTGG